jgi:hypothetical protein
MVRCYYCGRETALYGAGSPICVGCAEQRRGEEPSAHSRLDKELADANSEHSTATADFNRAMADLRGGLSHPDEAKPLHCVFSALSVAKARLDRAHARFANFLDYGTVPDDLLKD